jgi:Zn-dependent protease with chaperone function
MVSNAAVMGAVGRLRYVLLSDALLETMPDEQIVGVFAHELGHAIHRHIVYYLMLLAAVLVWIAAAESLVTRDLVHAALTRLPFSLHLRDEYVAEALQAAVVVGLAIPAALLFFWVSRNQERQADRIGQ